jgi:hypothetical protein
MLPSHSFSLVFASLVGATILPVLSQQLQPSALFGEFFSSSGQATAKWLALLEQRHFRAMCAVAARLPTPAARNAVFPAVFADANVAAMSTRELVECCQASRVSLPQFTDHANLFFGMIEKKCAHGGASTGEGWGGGAVGRVAALGLPTHHSTLAN